MNKILIAIFILIAGALSFLFFYYADKVDADFNPTYINKPYKFTQRSLDLYNSLDFVADLHCDALMWQRNMNKKHDFGHVDIPRMQEGRLAFQAFTMVTKSPSGLNVHQNDSDSDRITGLVMGQGKPPSTWFSLMGRAVHQCKKLNNAAKKNPFFHMIGSSSDLVKFMELRKKNDQHVSGFLGVEGGHCLEGKIENLQILYDLGVRMLGPTHFFDNELGGSAHGMKKEGLTDFGKEVIQFMDDNNMIIDIAHSSNKIVEDVLRISQRPVISSHTGVKGTCNTPRNLSDNQIKGIAEKGGLIGIGFFDLATCGDNISDIVKAMKYVSNLVGAEYVALGSDFDGTVTTPFDATGFPLLVEEMIVQGFSNEEIRKIMGENVYNFFINWLPQ